MAHYGELEYISVSRVYIVLLNWNNWPDTLECLESLLRLEYPSFRIVVCDNGSTDESMERLRAWADGKLDVLNGNRDLSECKETTNKPLQFDEYERYSAESGGKAENCARLVVIRNGENLGFAGGNNVGLRFAMARRDADYVWILNNDTIVDSMALQALVRRVQEEPEAGICGSTVLDYWQPQRVDALGGAYYCRWMGLAWHFGRWRNLPKRVNSKGVERRMDYVVGSSMFVSMRFLQEIGLMEESYFLYYEELDWAMRSKGRFSLAYSPESLVYHKIGGSIGTSSHPVHKSVVSDFYTLRNRLKFTRQHCPYALPTIYLGLLGALAVRLAFGQWRRALMVVRLMINPHISYDKCTA